MDDLRFALAILIWPLCVMIIVLILLQGGAGDLSSAFGGGGQLDSTLGVGASRKMSKLTAWLAGLFVISVIILVVPHRGSLGINPEAKPAASGHGTEHAAGANALPPIPTSQPGSAPAGAASASATAAAVAPALSKPELAPVAPSSSAPSTAPTAAAAPAQAPAPLTPAAPPGGAHGANGAPAGQGAAPVAPTPSAPAPASTTPAVAPPGAGTAAPAK